jgi:hypothetical protein
MTVVRSSLVLLSCTLLLSACGAGGGTVAASTFGRSRSGRSARDWPPPSGSPAWRWEAFATVDGTDVDDCPR